MKNEVITVMVLGLFGLLVAVIWKANRSIVPSVAVQDIVIQEGTTQGKTNGTVNVESIPEPSTAVEVEETVKVDESNSLKKVTIKATASFESADSYLRRTTPATNSATTTTQK